MGQFSSSLQFLNQNMNYFCKRLALNDISISVPIMPRPLSYFNSFVGIQNWSSVAQSVTIQYTRIRISTRFIISLTNTFLFLYILNALGFFKASIIITITLAVQLITDYPFGAISDKIGQKWILAISMFFTSTGFFLLAFATNYVQFIIYAIINGFANAQSSGALESWYDNNYQKFALDDDAEKKEYGFMMSRVGAIDTFVYAITIIVGGFLATSITRSNVFLIDGIFGIIVFFMILKLMKVKDFDNKVVIIRNKEMSALETFKGGVKFVFKDRNTAFFLIGYGIYSVWGVIWNNLLLFPFYFGYAGSDAIAGLLRSSLQFSRVVIMIAIAGIIKKLNKRKLVLIFVIQYTLLFVGMGILIYFLPIRNQFSWTGIIVIYLLFLVATIIFGTFSNIISQRVLLDYFPSEYRNSLHSFIPTITGIVSIFFLPLAGNLIENHGFFIGLAFCGIFAVLGSIMMEISMKSTNYFKTKTPEVKSISGATSVAYSD